MTTKLPEKIEPPTMTTTASDIVTICPLNQEAVAINQLIHYLTARQELEDARYKEFTSRIDTIAVNQQVQAQHIQNLRGGWTDVEIRASSLKKEPTEPYFPQMCWCGEVDCMGAEVEVGGKVHRPDHPCYELEMKRGDQPKHWRAEDSDNDGYWYINDWGDSMYAADNRDDRHNFRYAIGNYHPTREAAEAYKAKLLADNQQ